jgi:hypothetical protein
MELLVSEDRRKGVEARYNYAQLSLLGKKEKLRA